MRTSVNRHDRLLAALARLGKDRGHIHKNGKQQKSRLLSDLCFLGTVVPKPAAGLCTLSVSVHEPVGNEGRNFSVPDL